MWRSAFPSKQARTPCTDGEQRECEVGVKVVIDDGICSTQVAGPTEVVGCKSVEVARVQPEQPTPKSFRVDRRWILWSFERC